MEYRVSNDTLYGNRLGFGPAGEIVKREVAIPFDRIQIIEKYGIDASSTTIVLVSVATFGVAALLVSSLNGNGR